MESDSTSSPRQNTRRAIGVLVICLLLWLLLRPARAVDVALDQRRAQLEEAIRQRDEVPSPRPVAPIPIAEPASPAPGAAIVLPPENAKAPLQKELPAPPADHYMERVHQHLRSVELKHYDELARRKEAFDQKVRTESAQLNRQMAELANFQAPPPRVVLSAAVKQRLTYCTTCHRPRDPVELADMFARAADFH